MSMLSPAVRRVTEQIQSSVERLEVVERKMYDRLTSQSEYFPGLEIIVTGLPRKLRDLLLLQCVEGLPFNIEFTIREKINWQLRSKNKEELQHFLELREKLLSDNLTEREIHGRMLPRILYLLKRIAVNLKFPRKPKQVERPRKYKDQGAKQSNASKNLNQISRDESEKKFRETYKARLEQLVFEYSTNYETMVEDNDKYRPVYDEIAADIRNQIVEHLLVDPAWSEETHSISPTLETTLNRILKGTYPFGEPEEGAVGSVVATYLDSRHFVD